MNLIVEVVTIMACIVLGGLSLHYKANNTIKEYAAIAIIQAELAYKDVAESGDAKFDFAVEKIYAVLPVLLKPFVTKQLVEKIVQSSFNNVQTYAKTQLDKLKEAYLSDSEEANHAE